MGLGFCKAAIGSFIGWVLNAAKRCKTSAWNEDPVNLQVPEEVLACRCGPCVGCPDIAKCINGDVYAEQ